MNKRIYRAVIIYAVLVVAAVYVYPTIGWMTLSQEARNTRLDAWEAEDSEYHEPAIVRDTAKSIKRWAQFDRSKVVTLGLDLQGGVHMVVGFDLTEELKEQGMTDEYLQNLILRRIRRRINDFEAKDPIIQAAGTKQIQIQLPGEQDIDRAVELIKKTAYLTFHIVAGPDETLKAFQKISTNPKFKNRFTPFLLRPAFQGGPFRVPPDHLKKIQTVAAELSEDPELMPEDKTILFSQPPNPWDDEQNYEMYLVDKQHLMSGEGLRMALDRPNDEQPGKYQIHFQFTGAATNQFAEATGNNIGRSMAIVVDGVVVSAPTIQSRIAGTGRITGNFTAMQARDLAIALNSGSMPVPIREDFTGTVGASLGRDSIQKGVYASVGALIAVAALMVVCYRVGGVVACIALFLNGVIMLAAFAYFRLTLTLPGIAGFVLTMGMAVDANVLIFERIREEVRNGKSLVSAIELGYQKATVTILDANITTLIAALVLLQFGTGPVQGFGVALAIGICTSVFTALVVTQAVFDFLTGRGWLKKLSMMTLMKPDTKIRFIELRNKAFLVSAILIVVGVGLFVFRGEDNFGVDFRSGTSLIARLEAQERVNIADVRERLIVAGFTNPIVQEYGGGQDLAQNVFAVRTVDDPAAAGEGEAAPDRGAVRARVQEALAPLCGGGADVSSVHIEQEQSVGPAIGAQLRIDALKAVFFALMFMIAYMWFRYNLVFGITAIVALIHDVIISVGLLSLYGGHLDMIVIAAVLTIIGYSVNDTVVVFDRIRENMRSFAGREFNYAEIMNLAINQTLSRTILTSGLTLLAVAALFVAGGPVLRDFAFCLIMAVVVGTFSSVFVASSLAYVWQNWRQHHQATGPRKGHRRGKEAASTRKMGKSKPVTT